MWASDLLFSQYGDIQRNEWRRALLLAAWFFLVIATYWILKPIKRGIIINYFGDRPLDFFGLTLAGAEAEQLGKVLNMIFAYLAAVFFIWLARRLPRQQLVLAFAAIFGAALIGYAAAIERLNQFVVWSFYVFGDVFNTVMVTLFWAFTNDMASPGEARRTYGVIGLGGVLGGFAGATFVSSTVESFGRAPLLLAAALPMAAIVLIAFVVTRSTHDGRAHVPAANKTPASALFEGARLVFRSRYLLSIAFVIACYELVSNIVDFQLAATVERTFEHSLEMDAFFAFVGQIAGIGSIAVQALVTGLVLRRFGVQTALLFLPAMLAAGSFGFLLVPSLFFAAALSAGDNTLNYSINQSAKETLYTPVPVDARYKGKAFIDMFVQRFAKVVSVVLNLAVATLAVGGVRWLAAVSLGVLLCWILLICYVARRFRAHTDRGGGEEPCLAGRIRPRFSPTG